jgi:hypothetical protein
MKTILVLLLLHGIALSETTTIEEFLSTTPLGKNSEEVEKMFRLEPGTLQKHSASRTFEKIGTVEYHGFDFESAVLFENGDCEVFGIWARQLATYKNGKRLFKGKTDLRDVYGLLSEQLEHRYGKAPRVVTGQGNHLPDVSPTFFQTWKNKNYILTLFFVDNHGDYSICLNQYTNDPNGRWYRIWNEAEETRIIYKSGFGKLPDDWPSKTASDASDETSADVSDETTENKNPSPPAEKHQAPAPPPQTETKQKANPRTGSGTTRTWIGLAAFLAIVALAAWLLRSRSPKNTAKTK